MGENEFTIPWNKLTFDTRLGGYRTDVTEQQLKGAPDFGRGERDWADRDRERAFNDYYGAPHYWDT
jgi:hypothetical protein